MVDKIGKNQFISLIQSANPKMTKEQINSLWVMYDTMGIMPSEFESLFTTKKTTLAPNSNSVWVQPSKQNAAKAQITPQKTYSRNQEKQLCQDALEFLLESSSQAEEILTKQADENGFLGTMVDGFKAIGNLPVKAITGKNFFTQGNETSKIVEEEANGVKHLKNALSQGVGKFEFVFEQERGIPFNATNIDNFNQSSKKFTEVSAFKEKYDVVKNDLNEFKQTLSSEFAIKARSLNPNVKIRESLTKDTRFTKILDELCQGNQELKNHYIQKLSSMNAKPQELIQMQLQELNRIENNAEKMYKKELGSKTYEQYEKEYNQSLEKAFGKKNSKAMAQAYMQSQKAGIVYSEIGITIATTMLLGGSNLVAQGGAKLTTQVGTKAAGQIIKGGLTLTGATVAPAVHIANAATSEAGITKETIAEAKESFKSGLIYGGIGAYISAPLGQIVGNLVKSQPQVVSGAMSKVFSKLPTKATAVGFATEVSADTLLQGMISDQDLASAFTQNGSMEAVMRMIAGGRAHFAAEGIKVLQTKLNSGEVNYEIKNAKGEILGETKDVNKVADTLLNVGEIATGQKAAPAQSLNGLSYEKSKNPFVKDKVTLDGRPIARTKNELINQFSDFTPKENYYKKQFKALAKNQKYTQEQITEISKALLAIKDNVGDSKNFIKRFSDELLSSSEQDIKRFNENIKIVSNDDLNISGEGFYRKDALTEILFKREPNKLLEDIKIRNSYERCSKQANNITATRLIYDQYGCAEELKELTNLLSENARKQIPENAVYNFSSNTNHYKFYNKNDAKILSMDEVKTLAENINLTVAQNKDIPDAFFNVLSNPKRYLEIVEYEKNIPDSNMQKRCHSPEDVVYLLKIENDKWAKIKERSLLDNSKTEREFNLRDIEDLASMPDEYFELAKNRGLLKNIDGRKIQFTGYEISQFTRLPDEIYQSVVDRNLLNDIEGRSTKLNFEDINNLARIQTQAWRALEKSSWLKDIPGRSKPLCGQEIVELFKYEITPASTTAQNIETRGLFKDIEGRANQFGISDIKELGAMHELKWQRVLDRGLLKRMEIAQRSYGPGKQLTGQNAAQLATLDNNKFTGFLNVLSELRENKLDVPDILGAYTIKNVDTILKNNKKFIESCDEAFLKKNQLKSGIADISDSAIKEIFQSQYIEINTTLEILDKPTFVHSYSSKLSGVEDLVKKCSDIKEQMSSENYELLLQKFNPENSQRYSQLQTEITELKKSFPAAKAQGQDALNALYQKNNELSGELKKMQKGVDLDPQSKISKIRALAAISGGEDDAMFIDLIKAKTPENEKAWNLALNKKVFDYLGLEYDEQLSQRLNLSENKYLAEILSGNIDFKENFKDLVVLIKENPNRQLNEILNGLPQNLQTKEMFSDLGINYEKWANANKNSFVAVEVKTSSDLAKQAAIEGLEAEFNDHAFLALPKDETGKLIKKLKESAYELKEVEETIFDDNGFIMGSKKVLRFFHQEKPVEFSHVEKIISIIKKEINSNDFWSKKSNDPQMESYRETMYTHLVKDRDVQIKNAAALKTDEIAELEVRKTDMNNIQHALFLGNHGSCCTAVGTGGNQFSAPTYIKNKMVSAIEVVDGKDFVGNTMCYIAEVDGKPSLILDNIELNAKYQKNDKIREAMFEYARKMTEEIGQPNMSIYAGPYRHKLNMEHLQKQEHDMRVIGTTGEDSIYLDFITSGRVVDGNQVDKVKLYKIR